MYTPAILLLVAKVAHEIGKDYKGISGTRKKKTTPGEGCGIGCGLILAVGLFAYWLHWMGWF